MRSPAFLLWQQAYGDYDVTSRILKNELNDQIEGRSTYCNAREKDFAHPLQ
ncbi:MAG: hypothetical protein V7K57_06700 [Nostoc sp.]|uniref:hypothetical protein n=1 Tax=Nostoc sp. TaxID=1180 RepID=UPI002FF85413